MTRPYPLVTAHSGCMGSATNSREHIRLAIGSGADVVELDIRLSGDGRVVLSHDEAVELRGGGRLLIAEHPFEELAEAARDRRDELLDLETALDLLSGTDRVINLDAKEHEAAIVAAEFASRRGLDDLLLFSGLGETEARIVREKLPGFRCLLNADAFLPASGYGEGEIRAACRAATESGCCGVNLDWKAASGILMSYARRRCLPVLLWTIDDEEDLLMALELKPYSITTNRPDLLVRMIEGDRRGGKRT